MTAAGTAGRFTDIDGHPTALDPEHLPVDEDIGDLPACHFDNPAECLPRNVHPGCRLLLIQSFEIGQPQRLEFVEAQKNLFRTGRRRDSLRLEAGLIGYGANPSATFRSGHSPSPWAL